MRTRYDANGIYRGEDPVAALGAVGRVARNGMPTDYDPIWDAEHLYNSPHLSGNLAGRTNTISMYLEITKDSRHGHLPQLGSF